MDLLDRETPHSDTLLQITEAGVGQLNGSVAYTDSAVTAALPGTRSRNVLIGLETETRSAIVLFQQSDGVQIQLLQVIGSPGGKVTEIHGVSHHVVGPSGERPGMTLAQTGTDPASCRPGTNLWLGLAVCTARAAPNVRLLFSLRGEAATSATLPARDRLEAGELQQIIWSSGTTQRANRL